MKLTLPSVALLLLVATATSTMSAASPAQLPACSPSGLSANELGWNAKAVAADGQRAFVLEASESANHRIQVYSVPTQASGSTLLETLQSTVILKDPNWDVRGLTANDSGLQGIATNAVEKRSCFVVWSSVRPGVWVEQVLDLTGVSIATGSTISYDGRTWAALSHTGSSSLFVDLIAIDKMGDPFVHQTLTVGVGVATAPDRPMAVAHHGSVVAVRATADSLGFVYVYEDLATSGWTLNHVLEKVVPDAVPTTAALAVGPGQIVVGRDLGASFQQHVGMVYRQLPGSPSLWSPIDLLELPGAHAPGHDRRNLSTVRIDNDRIWLSQGENASLHAYQSTGISSPHVRDTSVRALGGPIWIAGGNVVGLTATGSAIASADSLLGCGATTPSK